MSTDDMDAVAAWIDQVVEAERAGDADAVERVAAEVHEFCRRFPAPGLTT
jgi:glycine/serine hydroxymethyltransferase